jgi:mRNA interferase HigB
MKVHLIKFQTIELFIERQSISRSSFYVWYDKLKIADWAIPSDIKLTYPSADLLGRGSERIVFDVGGNKYRMICKYHFGKAEVKLYIRWIGTHADYDKLCKKQEQYEV